MPIYYLKVILIEGKLIKFNFLKLTLIYNTQLEEIPLIGEVVGNKA